MGGGEKGEGGRGRAVEGQMGKQRLGSGEDDRGGWECGYWGGVGEVEGDVRAMALNGTSGGDGFVGLLCKSWMKSLSQPRDSRFVARSSLCVLAVMLKLPRNRDIRPEHIRDFVQCV